MIWQSLLSKLRPAQNVIGLKGKVIIKEKLKNENLHSIFPNQRKEKRYDEVNQNPFYCPSRNSFNFF